jgi:hypothetical protein
MTRQTRAPGKPPVRPTKRKPAAVKAPEIQWGDWVPYDSNDEEPGYPGPILGLEVRRRDGAINSHKSFVGVVWDVFGQMDDPVAFRVSVEPVTTMVMIAPRPNNEIAVSQVVGDIDTALQPDMTVVIAVTNNNGRLTLLTVKDLPK